MEGKIASLGIAVMMMQCCIGLSERDDPFSTPRTSHYIYGGSRQETGGGTEPEEDSSSLSICGVRVPEGYDWRKDTAIGINPECSIVLFRGLEEVLSFPAGYDNCVSTDPDTHHLIEGHLYTEFSTVSSTVLKKDGTEILRIPGRFRFAGICPTPDGLLTLMEKRDGVGFRFYRDRELVIERNDASLFGSFLDSSRPETGALSFYEGSSYFAYKATLAGYTSYHVVKGNLDTEFPWMMDLNLQDLRVIGGTVYPLFKYNYGFTFLKANDYQILFDRYVWSDDIRLFDMNGKPGVAGTGKRGQSAPQNLVLSADCITASEEKTGEWYIISAGDRFELVDSQPDDWYIFTPGSLRYYEGELYCVKSPRNIQMKECLLTIGSNYYPVKLNGYLTGVSIY